MDSRATSPVQTTSYLSIVWEQFRQNRWAMVGLVMTGCFFVAAFFAPFLAHRLPVVWSDGGVRTYPLLHEFFAPSDTTEPVLEVTYNFLLLFLPLAWGLLKILPLWEDRSRVLYSQVFGVLGTAALVYFIMRLGFLVKLSAYFGQGEIFLALLMCVCFVAIVGGFAWMAISFASQFSLSPRWMAVAALAAAVAVPFFLTSPKNDQTPYRELAAKGKGEGVFSLLPYGPNEQGFGAKLAPTWHDGGKEKKDYHLPGYHLLGTDEVGRDVCVRMIHGARVSLSVGFVSVGIATLIGLALGACAGYFGGVVDIVISRLIEIQICFPSFFLILTIIAIVDKRSILNIMLVIGLTGWTGVARLTRGEVLRQRGLDYVASARALGASSTRVIFRHIVPNSIGPVLVSVSFGIASAILTESGLSFLGFGVAPPTPTWGELLNQARQAPLVNWWIVIFPGLIIFLGVFAYNLVGEGLRDALDPRLRK